MSTLTLAAPRHAASPLRVAVDGFSQRRRLILGFALGFPVLFYLTLLAVLTLRYSHLPNYFTFYNWPANVWRIIVSTHSVADMIPIIGNEWLFETGYINYDYGPGVAEWSLSLVPHKLFLLFVTGALIGLNMVLLLERNMGTALQQSLRACSAGLLVSAGAFGTAVTNTSVFSVAHCATPTWIGSLAVFGFDSYDLFAIEPYGVVIGATGLGTLAFCALVVAQGALHSPASISSRNEVLPC